MTREDIIRMAREAGIRDCTCNGEFGCLERFAALVAAVEREVCILDIKWHVPRAGRHMTEYQMAEKMIARIRARGQA